MTQEAMRSALEALKQIADMDPAGQRADDLGRAARIASAAISQLSKALEDGGEAREGWKLVPVEPTEDMLVAGQEAWVFRRSQRNAVEDCTEADQTYRAMLSAAPDASRGDKP